MTKKNPVSTVQNIYYDAEQVDDADLTAEQNYNNIIQSGLINNHIGTGVLSETLNQNVILDTLLVSGLLDGVKVDVQNQPSDLNSGNQLELELTGSLAAGKKAVKVALIGLDFEGNLQYDTFYFKTNEVQITKKHYTNVLMVLFNDFIGSTSKSFNLGGRLVIKEVNPFTISRDPVMVSQDIEPNLFFRDFFVESATSLGNLLKTSLPLYNIDNLNIKTGYKEDLALLKNDVSSQIGQKFLATTNNIQKISLLMSVRNTDVGFSTDLAWTGDLVVSIYPLQSTTACPTDVLPSLPIEYSPSNIPVAQLSFNYSTLQQAGITLDGNPQPIDFVFSNTLAGSGAISPGNYYAITVKRSGSADKCDILLASGSDNIADSRVTLFTGSVWVDLTENDLWFKVYTDAVKVSDGQGYETGYGIVLPKTIINKSTNTLIDHCLDGISFSGSQLLTAVVSAEIEKSERIQDQRTGNFVNSRQQFVPKVNLFGTIDLANISSVTEPFSIGLVIDKNQKTFDASTSSLSAKIHSWSFIKDELLLKVITDNTDSRYDADLNALLTNVENGDFVNAKLIPNTAQPSYYYRVSKAEILEAVYGDLNNDGIIDEDDYSLYQKYIGLDLNNSPPLYSAITTNTVNTTFTNGYFTYSDKFASESSLSWQLVDSSTNVIASGVDGILTVNTLDGSIATFNSASTNFSAVSLLTTLKLVILIPGSPTNYCNYGGFTIDSLTTASNYTINISKIYLTSETLLQAMQADINGDFTISSSDGNYLQNYINRVLPFPFTTAPGSKIGTKFNVIKLKVEPFTFMSGSTADRNDDFYATIPNRATALHQMQDIFVKDSALASYNFLTTPITFSITKQLSWEESLIKTVSNVKRVPTVFTESSGLEVNECIKSSLDIQLPPNPPIFDPGIINTYSPNNIIVGGELKRPGGEFYKVDFEVGTVILEIPASLAGVEKTINIFDNFVAEYNNTGATRLGFKAMKFADCSFVQSDALTKDQVRFSVSMQSFSPNLDGIDVDGYSGVIVDGKMGVSIDYTTGMLKLNFANLYQDPTIQTLNTKVQVNVFMKKGSFNNSTIFVDSTKLLNLLELI